VDLIFKSVPNMVQIPVNNELLSTCCQRYGRSAKAGVARAQPVIFSF